MYVRWKRRTGGHKPKRWGYCWTCKKYGCDGMVTHARAAELVKSERIGGKPRQRIVAYLGIIAADGGEPSLGERLSFWREVGKRILKLESDGVLDHASRIATEQALHRVVPFPTASEQEEAAKAREAAYRELDALLARRGRVATNDPQT